MGLERRDLLTAVAVPSVATLAGCGVLSGGESDRLSQVAKLVADDGDSDDFFGGSVALTDDGSTALVGASNDEDPNGDGAGSAYVFTRTDEDWSQQTKLLPDDGDSEDGFGGSVALADDGSTALIGAYSDEDPNGDRAGSAYVFTRTGDGWSQQTKLLPDDGDSYDFFGWSVALTDDGSTALIAAVGEEDPNGGKAGSAYVFTRSDEGWSQEAKLLPDDGESDDRFGQVVALTDDGSTALIGATKVDGSNLEEVGAAYVFTRTDEGWSQQAKLAPDDGDSQDYFGTTVAVANGGSTALIGASRDDGPETDEVGAAYVFVRDGANWSQQAKLMPDNGSLGESFGSAVALTEDGSTALIGASRDNFRDGSAFVFARDGTNWSKQYKLTPDGGGRLMGDAVALTDDGSTAICGAYRDNPNGLHSGSAYVFE